MIELSYEQKEEIGLKYVRDMLEPACPYGVKALKEEGFYGPQRSDALEEELSSVALMLKALQEAEGSVLALQHALSGLKDLSGSFKNGREQALTEVELFELSAFCRRLQGIIPLAEALPHYDKLRGASFFPVEEALRVLDPEGSGRLSFFVEDGRSPALLAARRAKKEAELALRQAGAANREALLGQRQEAARAEEEALKAIYAAMSRELRPHLPLLEANGAAAGHLDALIAKALLARRFDLTRPSMGGSSLVLEDARHPELAEARKSRGQRFVPLSLELPEGVTVLTGANMGGKSVALKTVLVNTALALSGCFVFARRARIPFFSRIELINRDFSNAQEGLSSFGGEIVRLKEALTHLSEGGLSLIIMDELARGTNAREGSAIVRGTLAYLKDKPAVTLLATHYDGAGELARRHYQVKGLQNMAPREAPLFGEERDSLRLIEQAMDYGLVEVEAGTPCPRDAFAICRLLGLPEEILKAQDETETI